jgi:hypothetical protein
MGQCPYVRHNESEKVLNSDRSQIDVNHFTTTYKWVKSDTQGEQVLISNKMHSMHDDRSPMRQVVERNKDCDVNRGVKIRRGVVGGLK